MSKKINLNLLSKLSKIRQTPLIFRLVLTTALTAVIFVGGFFGFSYYQQENKKIENGVEGESEVISFGSEILREFADYTPKDFIYQEIAFVDLPIYPEPWQKSHFGNNQNPAISGPNGDPDGDGLINKLEYMYGANPKNPDTLCGNRLNDKECVGRNDKENVDLKISPLTGEDLAIPEKITIKRQDYSILSQIEDSFAKASEEGVDFPTLYQLSREVDLSDEVGQIEVNSVESNIKTVAEYNEFRVDVVDTFISSDEVSEFSKVYNLVTLEEVDRDILRYSELLEKVQNVQVPEGYENSHKYLEFLVQRVKDLLEHRKTGFEYEILPKEFKEVSRKKAIEVVWSYRVFGKENDKIEVE